MKFEIDKSQGVEYYTIKELFYRGSIRGYSWEDVGRTFSSVKDAEDYVKTHAGQREKFSQGRFHIIKETSIELIVSKDE